MMKIPVQQMFYVKMTDFGFVWSLYFISLDPQQIEEIMNIYIYYIYWIALGATCRRVILPPPKKKKKKK